MNCSYNITAEVKLFQLTVYIPTFIFGVAFNGLALWIFCFRMKKWSETRVYMINLIIADCSLLFTLPFKMYAYNYPWNLGYEMCKTLAFIFFLNSYMSILIITMVAVDRYVAIKYPFKSKALRSPCKAAVICVLVWIILISSRVYLVVYDYKKQANSTTGSRQCFQKKYSRPMKRILAYTIMGFIAPFIILSFCSIEVIRTLKRKLNTSPDSERSVRKAMHTVIANLVVFVVCFLPIHVAKLIRFHVESNSSSYPCSLKESIQRYELIADSVSDLNCCFDAICYYFVAKEFWEASHLPFMQKLLPSSRNTTQESSL